jgi:uncharacterized protein (DUF58 family)
MSDPVIATLAASPPRRWTGTVMLSFLGGLLIYLALSVPFSAPQVILILCGLFVLFAASRLLAATAQVIELTQTELRVKDGVVLAKLADITKVERGAFAFKPSNGFLVSTKESAPYWCGRCYWRTAEQRYGRGDRCVDRRARSKEQRLIVKCKTPR